MIAYRLVHQLALNATGGQPLVTKGASGRWNSQGVFITYLAEHPALAALEVLNYAGMYRDLHGYVLFGVEIPDGAIMNAPETLDVHDHGQTRPYGDAWARAGKSLALRVPSVAAPLSHNVLLNQQHPLLLTLNPVRIGPFNFDARVTALIEKP